MKGGIFMDDKVIEWVKTEMANYVPVDHSKDFEIKDYKKHEENGYFVLDEVVNIRNFTDDNNFTGGCYYDESTGIVKAYALECQIDTLHKYYKNSGLQWRYYYWISDQPEIVPTATKGKSWLFEAKFGLRSLTNRMTFKMDTGATFSVVNLRDLLKHTGLSYELWLSYLRNHKYTTVCLNTASEKNVTYLAISAQMSLFSHTYPIILYVDIKNRLNSSLLGLDIISSMDFIARAGEAPTLLNFSKEAYEIYVQEHRSSDNACIELSALFE